MKGPITIMLDKEVDNPVAGASIDAKKLLRAWELNVQTQRELLAQLEHWSNEAAQLRSAFVALRFSVVATIAVVVVGVVACVGLKRDIDAALANSRTHVDEAIAQMDEVSSQIAAVSVVSLKMIEAQSIVAAESAACADDGSAAAPAGDAPRALIEVQAKSLGAQARLAPHERVNVTARLQALKSRARDTLSGLALDDVSPAIEAAEAEAAAANAF